MKGKGITIVAAAVLLCLCGCARHQTAPVLKEKQEQWTSLFNGQNLEGWTPKFAGRPLGENYKNTFRVENGILKVSYDQYEQFEGRFGHLFYAVPFSHYRLRLEYRFVGEQAKGGPSWAFRNSGIMIHCQKPETMGLEQNFPVCLEVQLLGGDGQNERTTGNLCTPGTHVVIQDRRRTEHCILSSSPTFHGDQWVKAEVEVHGDRLIRHLINGQVVLEYSRPELDDGDADARKLIEAGTSRRVAGGYISLQAESHPVEFRNIELLVLEE
ncbi:MAG TPA: DUF1080 domain-containing protein [Anaerohalosphaeraceae bacterium]|nr:DUF1080 domain-containing protein [Anaerohalosphaeraceae bacterium]